MNTQPIENQFFYKKDESSSWEKSRDGVKWPDEKCEGYLHKHLTWDEFQLILNPPKTNDELFNEELDQLNNDRDSAMKGLVEDYSYAVSVDGSTETEKVLSIRNEMTAVNDQYAVDQLALINKYYGE